MANSKLKTALRKSTAILSAFAVMMSYGTIGLFTASAEGDLDPNDPGAATDIRMYDMYGNDITDEPTPTVYVDNSSIAGQATWTYVDVVISNRGESELIDQIQTAPDPKDKATGQRIADVDHILINSDTHSKTYRFYIYGCDFESSERTDPITKRKIPTTIEKSYFPGEFDATIYTDSAKSQKLKIVTQEPANDMSIKFANATSDNDLSDPKISSSSSFPVNEYSWYNSTWNRGVEYVVVQNHQYQLSYDLDTKNKSKANPLYLDKVEWSVYDGSYNNSNMDQLVAADTTKAQISKSTGVFTPNGSGRVTVVANFAPTPASDFNYNHALKAYEDTENDVTTAMPTFTANPISGERTDRPFAHGTKKLRSYAYDTDTDGTFILRGNQPVRTVDDNGKYSVLEYTDSWESNRTSFNTRGSDSRNSTSDDYGTFTSDPIIDPETKLQTGFTPVNNVPKFVQIMILKENPVKEIKFTELPNNKLDDEEDTDTEEPVDTDTEQPADTDTESEPIPVGTMQLNETFQIKYNAIASYSKEEYGDDYAWGATDDFQWSSSNPSIVSVDDNGNITAKGKGTATITVRGETNKEGKYVSASCLIEVRTLADSLYLTPSPTETREGVEADISAVMSPRSADEYVSWYTEDPEIATVTGLPYESSNIQKAVITGHKEGVTTLRAVTRSGKMASTTVSVYPRKATQNISLKTTDEDGNTRDVQSEEDLFTTQEITFNALMTAEDGSAADAKAEWEILNNEDDRVIVVDQNNESLTLRGVAKGDVTVRVKEKYSSEAEDGTEPMQKTFVIHVLKGCDKVTITRKGESTAVGNRSLNVGSEISLAADLTIDTGNNPYDHDDTLARWVSSDPKVATVDEDGNISALKDGKTVISAIARSGVFNVIEISVFTASSLTLTGDQVMKDEDYNLYSTMQLNNELTATKNLSAAVRNTLNEPVANVECKWTSSNEDVATVKNGVVTGRGAGVATITVASGAQKQNCKITVYAPITAVDINGKNPAEIAPYTYSPLKASYSPGIDEDHPIVLTVPGYENGQPVIKTLTDGVDYKLEYTNNDRVGTASLKINGLGLYNNTVQTNYLIQPRSLNSENVSVFFNNRQECTGRAIVPDVSVYCDGTELTENVDYVLGGFTNTTFPTTAETKASFTVTGRGSYADAVPEEFEIYCDHKELKDVNVLSEPSYDEDGLQQGTCVACGETGVTQLIPRFPHTTNPATALSFDSEEYGLNVNEQMKLEPIAITNDMTQPATDAFRWVSENPGIVSVDENGNITGRSKGVTTITIIGENDKVTASCNVKVLVKAEEIKFDKETIDTRLNVSAEVKAIVTPENNEDEIVWISADPSIATVTPSETSKNVAIVTGVSVGQTTLIAKCRYSGISAEATVNVGERYKSDVITITTRIGDRDSDTPLPTSDPNSEYIHKIYSNDRITFNSILTNYSGMNSDDVTIWKITDNESDTVTTIPSTEPGELIEGDSVTLQASSFGTVTVSAYPKSDPSKETHFKLEVTERCTTITVKDDRDEPVTARSLNVSDHLLLKADLTNYTKDDPYDHGDEVREWSSSNPDVASVDQNGYVTAKKNGTAVITVWTLSNQKRDTNITVFTTSGIRITGGVKDGNPPTAEMILNPNAETRLNLTATVYQNEQPVQNVINKWSSSDEAVATVSETGIVTAHSVGSATISVKSGTKTAQCKLTVTSPITAMKYDEELIKNIVYSASKPESMKPELTLKIGDTTLVKGKDYNIEYVNADKAGNAAIDITGLGFYTGTTRIGYSIAKRSLKDASVKVETIPNQNYTGSPITPAVRVTCDNIVLKQDVDYTVSYSNNVEAGTATVIIGAPGNSNYSETREASFTIVDNSKKPDKPGVVTDGMMGDVDEDGEISAADALMILRSSVGLDAPLDDTLFIIADVNQDEEVDSADAVAILRYSVSYTDADVLIGVTA